MNYTYLESAFLLFLLVESALKSGEYMESYDNIYEGMVTFPSHVYIINIVYFYYDKLIEMECLCWLDSHSVYSLLINNVVRYRHVTFSWCRRYILYIWHWNEWSDSNKLLLISNTNASLKHLWNKVRIHFCRHIKLWLIILIAVYHLTDFPTPEQLKSEEFWNFQYFRYFHRKKSYFSGRIKNNDHILKRFETKNANFSGRFARMTGRWWPISGVSRRYREGWNVCFKVWSVNFFF